MPASKPRYSHQATALRAMLQEAHNDPTKAVKHPIAYDGLTARLVEQAGFEFVFLGGYAVSASHGLPDAGYLGFAEMTQRCQEVSRVVSIPIMVDGDTGYGNEAQVRRTVQGYAIAGAAGIMIEDQVAPKRCGHTKGKRVVPREEAVNRVKAAVEARNGGLDIVILARTDALIVSLDEAIARAKAFRDLGADCVAIEALPDRESMERAIREVSGIPQFINYVEGGKTAPYSADEFAQMGFCSIAYPITLLSAGIIAMRSALESLKETSKKPPLLMPFGELCSAVGFDEYYAISERYGI